MELQPLYEKKITCYVCQKTYKTQKLRSRFIKPIQHDSDFCSYYQNEENNPLLYHINVCPNCGYAFSSAQSPYLSPSRLEAIQTNLCSKWVPKNYGGKRSYIDAIDTYKLAIYAGHLTKEKHIIMAGFYLRLAWIYRTYSKNIEEEMRFLELALYEYIQSYQVGDYEGTIISEIKLLYLVGELSRRTNNEKQAIKYFSRVIEKQRTTTERRIVELARDQWEILRFSRKNQAQAN